MIETDVLRVLAEADLGDADGGADGPAPLVRWLVVDLRTRWVVGHHQSTRLTRVELGVLTILAGHGGIAVHRRTLIESIWGRHVDPASCRLRMAVSRLRNKIGEANIVTVHGWGYALHPAVTVTWCPADARPSQTARATTAGDRGR